MVGFAGSCVTFVIDSRRYHSQGKLKITLVFIIACLLNIVDYRPRFLIKFIVDK